MCGGASKPHLAWVKQLRSTVEVSEVVKKLLDARLWQLAAGGQSDILSATWSVGDVATYDSVSFPPMDDETLPPYQSYRRYSEHKVLQTVVALPRNAGIGVGTSFHDYWPRAWGTAEYKHCNQRYPMVEIALPVDKQIHA